MEEFEPCCDLLGQLSEACKVILCTAYLAAHCVEVSRTEAPCECAMEPLHAGQG